MASSRTDSSGISAQQFLQAAREGKIDIVNAYIAANRENPAAINIANEGSGNTALILAAGFGHIAVVAALLAVPGIEVTKKNNAGISAATFALQRRQDAVVQLLKESFAEAAARANTITADEYLRAAEAGNAAIVRQYIIANFNRDAINIKQANSQNTALILAARNGHVPVIDELVKTGLLDLDAENQQRHTAAREAEQRGYSEIAVRLTTLAQMTPVSNAQSATSSSSSGAASVSSAVDDDGDQLDFSDHSLDSYMCTISQMLFFQPVVLSNCGDGKHIIECDYVYGTNGVPKIDKCPCCRANISTLNPAKPAPEIEKAIEAAISKNPMLNTKRYFNPVHLKNVLEQNQLDTDIGKKLVAILENAANHLFEAIPVLINHENGRKLLRNNKKMRDLISRPALRELYLVHAVNLGDLEKVKTLVARGADINTVLGLLIAKQKSDTLWWLHADKAARDAITKTGLQAIILEGKYQGKTVAETLVKSRKGCQLLIEDERLQALYPAQLEGKSIVDWLAAKKAEQNFSCSGFFAEPLTSEEKKKKYEAKEAKKLLEYVLFPVEANIKKLIDMAKSNPQCFFIKATAQDHAKDFSGNRRTIEDWSPYQAMFGTSDNDLIAEVKPLLEDYLRTKIDNDFVENHVKEKFPNGFDFPPSTFDFAPLVGAIGRDPFTNGAPNAHTLELLTQFQAAFKPGVVKNGHHFNMNDVIMTDGIYAQKWDPWNGRQLAFFDVNICGFLQRLKTGVYLQVDRTGLDNHVNKNQPLKRDYKLRNYVSGKDIEVLPLDGDPGCLLGRDFLVENYYGGGARWVWGWVVGVVRALQKTCVEQKQRACQTYAAKSSGVTSRARVCNSVT